MDQGCQQLICYIIFDARTFFLFNIHFQTTIFLFIDGILNKIFKETPDF